MATLRYCTFTGVGHSTPLADLKALSQRFPFIEWGVLYDPKRAGHDARYPSLEWIREFAAFGKAEGLNTTLHLCDDAAQTALSGRSAFTDLFAQFGRVQVNGELGESDCGRALQDLGAPAVAQWRSSEPRSHASLRRLMAEGVLCNISVDDSLGRDALPERWPSIRSLGLPGCVAVGYAGGIGRANITQVVDALRLLNPDLPFSVGMESSLFVDTGEFSLEACEDIAGQVAASEARHDAAIGAQHIGRDRAVESLEGLWLDYWVARTQGLPVTVPDMDAAGATVLNRVSGHYERFEAKDWVLGLIDRERICIEPLAHGGCRAKALRGTEWLHGRSIELACLRAVVARHFGGYVPRNPTLR